jgi:hypothetical protein
MAEAQKFLVEGSRPVESEPRLKEGVEDND